jgi:hypothetical protein
MIPDPVELELRVGFGHPQWSGGILPGTQKCRQPGARLVGVMTLVAPSS